MSILLIITLLAVLVAVGAIAYARKANRSRWDLQRELDLERKDRDALEEAEREKQDLANTPDSGLAARANGLFMQDRKPGT